MSVAVRKEKNAGVPDVTTASVRRRAEQMLTWLETPAAELSVLLTDDERMQALNRTYRQKDRPTDVLAFAMAEGANVPASGGRELLGDVVISLSTASRQAQQHGHTALDEVTHLLAHGLLHLLGYDHENDEDEREMVALTQQLVAIATARRTGRSAKKR